MPVTLKSQKIMDPASGMSMRNLSIEFSFMRQVRNIYKGSHWLEQKSVVIKYSWIFQKSLIIF